MSVFRDNLLTEDDVRAMIRLLSDVAELETHIEAKRVRLIDGLCSIIGAEKWAWSMMGGSNDGDSGIAHTLFLHGGFNDEELTRFLEVQEHEDLGWMTEKFFSELGEPGKNVTRLEQQMVTDEKLENAAIYPHLLRADLGPVVLFGRETLSEQLSVVSIFRRVGREKFSAREARIVHIILSEVKWMHEVSWPNHPRDSVSALSPRLRTVLCLLIQGFSRKQIAGELNLTVNTVHGYVKEIYQAFGVHSHAELMRRFLEGDGGDHGARVPLSA